MKSSDSSISLMREEGVNGKNPEEGGGRGGEGERFIKEQGNCNTNSFTMQPGAKGGWFLGVKVLIAKLLRSSN